MMYFVFFVDICQVNCCLLYAYYDTGPLLRQLNMTDTQ